ncbi:MAG: hypothetical protein IT307_07580 [Chloroflexi bacterium]|nr:hypothetical protein [Chloroflexota bacterium]
MRRTFALVAVAVAMLTMTACFGPRTLTVEEVDARAQEYYQRGLDQLAKNDARAAVESFQIAKAYDSAKRLPDVSDQIERAQARVRAGMGGSGSIAAAASGTSQAAPRQPDDDPLLTFRSTLYPYSIDVPRSWRAQSGAATVAGARADLFLSTKPQPVPPVLTVAAHRLPKDLDPRGYLETQIKLLKASGLNPQLAGERSVSGMSGWLVRTPIITDQGIIVSTLAAFGEPGTGWVVTLTAARDESERMQPLFQRILDSFRYGTLVST